MKTAWNDIFDTLVAYCIHIGQHFSNEVVLLKFPTWNLIIFSKNSKGYLNNQWANTRLVCTHLNAIFMLITNTVTKIWISKFFGKKFENFDRSSALDLARNKHAKTTTYSLTAETDEKQSLWYELRLFYHDDVAMYFMTLATSKSKASISLNLGQSIDGIYIIR